MCLVRIGTAPRNVFRNPSTVMHPRYKHSRLNGASQRIRYSQTRRHHPAYRKKSQWKWSKASRVRCTNRRGGQGQEHGVCATSEDIRDAVKHSRDPATSNHIVVVVGFFLYLDFTLSFVFFTLRLLFQGLRPALLSAYITLETVRQ